MGNAVSHPCKFDEVAVKNPLFHSHRRFVLILSALYFSLWVALAVEPTSREDWALENIVVLGAVLILSLTWNRYTFSQCSYLLIALFLTLHAIGSHYTYSEVPYRNWFELFRGQSEESVGTIARNHYDRFVHFTYGLLMYYPYRECFLQIARVHWKLWSYLVPLSFILSTSLIYELLEWLAATVLGGDVGIAFVGSQGDMWDAQMDCFCAFVGALITSTTLAVTNLVTKRDGASEWIRFSNQGH